MTTTIFADEVVETSQSLGTITYVLDGATSGYRSFRQGYSDGDTPRYAVRNAGNTKFELNRGAALTYGTPDTLARGTYLSSNGNAAVPWVASDMPLSVYVPSDAEVLNMLLQSWLSTARHALLKFGLWVKDAYPSSGFKTLYWYDGTGDITFGKYVDSSRDLKIDAGVLKWDKSYIRGLTYQIGAGDATNDIDFAAGCCMSDDGTERIDIAATTKQLDVAWAVDNGATPSGMLDTGAVANSPYYFWAIKNPTTSATAILASLSASSPTMPSGYTQKRLIGWLKRSGGANLAFKTYEMPGGGILFNWSTKPLSINLAATLTTSRRADALTVPLDFAVRATINAYMADTAECFIDIRCPDDADEATVRSLNVTTFTTLDCNTFDIWTSATGTIASRANTGTIDTFQVYTLGFMWPRR